MTDLTHKTLDEMAIISGWHLRIEQGRLNEAEDQEDSRGIELAGENVRYWLKATQHWSEKAGRVCLVKLASEQDQSYRDARGVDQVCFVLPEEVDALIADGMRKGDVSEIKGRFVCGSKTS